MKFTVLSSIALAAGVIANDNGGCNADNCARAVTGTRRGDPFVSSAMADCNSAMHHTEIAPAVTVTNTVTFTTTPATAPWYATACSGLVRYSSACDCWGIHDATQTITPTQTITTTVVVTATP